MPKKRGIVIAPPFAFLPDNEPKVIGDPSPADVRKYLLYWDEIDYPENDCIHFATGPDLEYLIYAKVAKRSKVILPRPISGKFHQFFLLTQEIVFENYEKESPGLWSLGQLSASPYFIRGNPTISVEYELWNMLPVPEHDVPLDDILEFKVKRHSELLALQIHLEEMYQSIIHSGDLPRAKNTQLAKLEMDLNGIDKTLSESQIRKSVTSLRGFITGEFVNVAGIGLGAASIAPYVGMAPLTTGVAGAGVTFALRAIRSPKVLKDSHPLTYVSSIKREL